MAAPGAFVFLPWMNGLEFDVQWQRMNMPNEIEWKISRLCSFFSGNPTAVVVGVRRS